MEGGERGGAGGNYITEKAHPIMDIDYRNQLPGDVCTACTELYIFENSPFRACLIGISSPRSYHCFYKTWERPLRTSSKCLPPHDLCVIFLFVSWVLWASSSPSERMFQFGWQWRPPPYPEVNSTGIADVSQVHWEVQTVHVNPDRYKVSPFSFQTLYIVKALLMQC